MGKLSVLGSFYNLHNWSIYMIAMDFIFAWQFIGLIIFSFIFTKAINKYRIKKSFLSRNLFLAFTFILFAIIFQIVGAILILFHLLSTTTINNNLIFLNNNQFLVESWIMFFFQRGKFSSFSLLISIYFFYRFSRYVFDGQDIYLKKTFKDKLMILMLIAIVCFGVLNYFIYKSNLPILIKFFSQSGIYVTIFIWIVMIPILIHGIKLVKFLIRKGGNYKRVLYLATMSGCFIISIFFYLIRNILSFFTGNVYDFLLFIGGGLLILAMIFAYLSFYSKNVPVNDKPTDSF